MNELELISDAIDYLNKNKKEFLELFTSKAQDSDIDIFVQMHQNF